MQTLSPELVGILKSRLQVGAHGYRARLEIDIPDSDATTTTPEYVQGAVDHWPCLTPHTSLSVHLAAPPTRGDLLVLCFGLCDSSSPVPPAGFDLAMSRIGTTEQYISLWWKVSDGTEQDVTVAWTGADDGAELALLQYHYPGLTGWELDDAPGYAWDVLNPANWPELNPLADAPAVLIFQAFDNGPSGSTLPVDVTLRVQTAGPAFGAMRVGDMLTDDADASYDLLGQNTVGAEYQVGAAAFHPVAGTTTLVLRPTYVDLDKSLNMTADRDGGPFVGVAQGILVHDGRGHRGRAGHAGPRGYRARRLLPTPRSIRRDIQRDARPASGLGR